MRSPLILCAILACPVSALAQEAPLLGLRVMAAPTGPIWLGQHVGVTAILRTPNRFAAPPTFPEPALQGRAVVLPNGSTTPGSEREGGTSYVLLQHRYDVFPLQAGSLDFPALRMELPVADADGTARRAAAASEKLRIEVRLPPGTQDPALLVTAPALHLDTRLDGDPTRLAVGEAITRHVTLTARDTSAMLLPPMPWAAPDGVRLYPNPPRLSDSSDRGVLSAVREDSAAFVPQRPGRYRLPAASFQWFNPQDGQMRRIDVPALVVEAIAAAPAPEADHRRPGFVLPVLALLAAGAACLAYRRRLGAWLARHRPGRTTPEAQAFADLLRACRQGQAAQACAALLRWNVLAIPAGERPTLRHLACLTTTPELETEGTRLAEHCFARPLGRDQPPGETAPPWSGHGLLTAARRARRRLRTTPRGFPARRGLPPLNPESTPTPAPRVTLPGWAR